MKTARKTYLLTGLVCAGLLWAGASAFGQPDPLTLQERVFAFRNSLRAAAFGQPDPLPQIQQFPQSEPDDPTADAIGPSDTDTTTQAGEPAPARGTTQSIPGLIPGAGEPAPALRTTLQVGVGSDGWIQFPLVISGEAGVLLKNLGAPGVTLQDLQQADQHLELSINRLVELYTRAIRLEKTKVTEQPLLELYSRELRGEETEDVTDPAQIREAIVGLVNKQFQIRQAMRKMEISSLEERIRRLNDLLQKREEAQAQIVESRLGQLLNAAEGLGWDNAAASGATSRPASTFRPTAVSGVQGIIRGSPSATPPTARYDIFNPRILAPTELATAAPPAPAPPPVPTIDR